ncbi:MAG TPA: hypothetical protein VGE72_11390, partial [Azospirillum sp.]
MAECFFYLLTEEGRESPVRIGASADPAKHLRQLQAGNPRPLVIRRAYRILSGTPPLRLAGELEQAIRQLTPGPDGGWREVSVEEADALVAQLARSLARPQQGRLVGAKRGFEAFGAEDLPDRFQLSAVAEAEVARWQAQAERAGPLDPGA